MLTFRYFLVGKTDHLHGRFVKEMQDISSRITRL